MLARIGEPALAGVGAAVGSGSLGRTDRSGLAAARCGAVVGGATTGSLNPMVTPAVELAATALEDEAVDDVTVVALTGAGGPRTAISAANASLKPSPLRPAAGALAGSFGSAGLAVVTWAEAASMAPMKRVVGKVGACCAGHSAPSSNPRANGEFVGQASEIYWLSGLVT